MSCDEHILKLILFKIQFFCALVHIFGVPRRPVSVSFNNFNSVFCKLVETGTVSNCSSLRHLLFCLQCPVCFAMKGDPLTTGALIFM